MAALYTTLRKDLTDLLNRYDDDEALFRQLRLLLQDYQDVQDLLDQAFPEGHRESDLSRFEGAPVASQSVPAATTGAL